MKPFYERDNVTIYCGEAGKVMGRYIDDSSIDLAVTSPPYDALDASLDVIPGGLRTYNGYAWDFKRIAGELWRVTKKGGVLVWVVGDATIDGSETGTSFRQALHFRGLGFNVETMIFYKGGNGGVGSQDLYWQEFEFMFTLAKGKSRAFNPIRDRHNAKPAGQKNKSNGRSKEIYKPEQWITQSYSKRGNVWLYNAGSAGANNDINHPAPFPEALARDHILSWSNPGNTVLDCFLGSGTTAKMAQQLGRRFVGIEISEEYCRLAVDRLRQPSFFSLPSVAAAEAKPEQAELW